MLENVFLFVRASSEAEIPSQDEGKGQAAAAACLPSPAVVLSDPVSFRVETAGGQCVFLYGGSIRARISLPLSLSDSFSLLSSTFPVLVQEEGEDLVYSFFSDDKEEDKEKGKECAPAPHCVSARLLDPVRPSSLTSHTNEQNRRRMETRTKSSRQRTRRQRKSRPPRKGMPSRDAERGHYRRRPPSPSGETCCWTPSRVEM